MSEKTFLLEARRQFDGDAPAVTDAPDDLSMFSGSVVYFIFFLFGTGVLVIPYAVRLSGWIGILIVILIGFLVQHSSRALGVCQYKHSLDTYPEIVELLFETTIFLLLLGQSITMLTPLSKNAAFLIGMAMFIVLSNVFIFPQVLMWLGKLRSVSTVLLSATVVTACILTIAEKKWEHCGPMHAVTTWHDTCKAIGIFIYCFISFSVAPSIVRNTLRPSQFSQIVSITFCFLQAVYVLVATTGYLAFGDHTQSNILFNVAPRHEAFKYTINILMLCVVSSKYALASLSITESLIDWLEMHHRVAQRDLGLHEESQRSVVDSEVTTSPAMVTPMSRGQRLCNLRCALVIQILFRSSVPVIAYGMTFAFRDFAYMVSLVGGFFGSLISIVFPSLCYVCICYSNLSRRELWMNYFIMALGIFLFAITLLVNIG